MMVALVPRVVVAVWVERKVRLEVVVRVDGRMGGLCLTPYRWKDGRFVFIRPTPSSLFSGPFRSDPVSPCLSCSIWLGI